MGNSFFAIKACLRTLRVFGAPRCDATFFRVRHYITAPMYQGTNSSAP